MTVRGAFVTISGCIYSDDIAQKDFCVTPVIEADKLTKTYEAGWFSGQDVHALSEVSFRVEPGEIFGYLGPNGSGKTTTIKMLLGIIYPSSGEGYVLGKEIGDMDVHRIISYLPERPYYYEHMTGMELLKIERTGTDGDGVTLSIDKDGFYADRIGTSYEVIRIATKPKPGVWMHARLETVLHTTNGSLKVWLDDMTTTVVDRASVSTLQVHLERHDISVGVLAINDIATVFVAVVIEAG